MLRHERQQGGNTKEDLSAPTQPLVQRTCACEDEARAQAVTGMGITAEEEDREQPVLQRSTSWAGATVHETLSPAKIAVGTQSSPITWEILNGTIIRSGGAAAAAIKVPTLSISGSGSSFTAKVDSVPAQTAGADETVLGPGPWRTVITKAAAGGLTGLPVCSGAGNSTFRMKGSPSDRAVYEANRRHEDRHVADHGANFRAIVGAWDTKVQDAKNKGTAFNGASGPAAEAALWAAMGGTAGVVATRWFDQDGISGDAYHATAKGGPMVHSNPKAAADCSWSSLDVTNPS